MMHSFLWECHNSKTPILIFHFRGDRGLWVKYPDGTIKEVICMKDLKGNSKNVLSEYIYTVLLVVEEDYCVDEKGLLCPKTKPRQELFTPAYLISATNVSMILSFFISTVTKSIKTIF